jgi:hypothetical protein
MAIMAYQWRNHSGMAAKMTTSLAAGGLAAASAGGYLSAYQLAVSGWRGWRLRNPRRWPS